MYQITVVSNDRVVNAGRVNAGKETLLGLDEKQIWQVNAGETVYVMSRRGNSAIVEISLASEKWRHDGEFTSLPKLNLMSTDQDRQAALLSWAYRSQVISSLGA